MSTIGNPAGDRFDVVVVGGGGSGAVVAARLGEDGREVLLLEAGTAPGSATEYPPELRNAASLSGAQAGHPDIWLYPAMLAEGRPHMVVRGRILGGSTAVNGAYFVRPRRSDMDTWAAMGIKGWGFDECLPLMRFLEADANFGESTLHGGSGPMLVRRPALDRQLPHPVSAAFAASAEAIGIPYQADQNSEQQQGHGPLPQNVRPRGAGYERWNTARAYLLGERTIARGGCLQVWGGSRVTRVLFEGHRAVGVEVERFGARSMVQASRVVLAAGAIGTAQILLRSGVGPREEIQRHDIALVAEAPGLGTAFSDHPQFVLPWHPRPGALEDAGTLVDWVLNTSLALDPCHSGATAEVELLPMLRPLRAALGMPHDVDGLTAYPVLLVGVQNPQSRGQLRLASDDPGGAPELDYHYLSTPLDRARARAAVRFAIDLIERPEFMAVSTGHDGPCSTVLADDDALDAWLLAHLGTAQHLCGTAPMGADSDPGAVTDERGAVRGTMALHIADLSLLPRVPSRGPAATAVLIGERIASFLRAND